MKRLIASALILSVFSVIGFVGCGEEPAKPAPAAGGGAAAPAPAAPDAPKGEAPK
jgi:hypothetical protein